MWHTFWHLVLINRLLVYGEDYPHQMVLLGTPESPLLILRWRANTTDVVVELEAQTKGWIALGISPDGRMHKSAILFAWVDGTGEVFAQVQLLVQTTELTIRIVSGIMEAGMPPWELLKLPRERARWEKRQLCSYLLVDPRGAYRNRKDLFISLLEAETTTNNSQLYLTIGLIRYSESPLYWKWDERNLSRFGLLLPFYFDGRSIPFSDRHRTSHTNLITSVVFGDPNMLHTCHMAWWWEMLRYQKKALPLTLYVTLWPLPYKQTLVLEKTLPLPLPLLHEPGQLSDWGHFTLHDGKPLLTVWSQGKQRCSILQIRRDSNLVSPVCIRHYHTSETKKAFDASSWLIRLVIRATRVRRWWTVSCFSSTYYVHGWPSCWGSERYLQMKLEQGEAELVESGPIVAIEVQLCVRYYPISPTKDALDGVTWSHLLWQSLFIVASGFVNVTFGAFWLLAIVTWTPLR